jgi:hypothetical protein
MRSRGVTRWRERDRGERRRRTARKRAWYRSVSISSYTRYKSRKEVASEGRKISCRARVMLASVCVARVTLRHPRRTATQRGARQRRSGARQEEGRRRALIEMRFGCRRCRSSLISRSSRLASRGTLNGLLIFLMATRSPVSASRAALAQRWRAMSGVRMWAGEGPRVYRSGQRVRHVRGGAVRGCSARGRRSGRRGEARRRWRRAARARCRHAGATSLASRPRDARAALRECPARTRVRGPLRDARRRPAVRGSSAH